MFSPAQLALMDALERRKLLVCVGPLVSTAAGLASPLELVERCRQRLASMGRNTPAIAVELGVAAALERAETLLGKARFVRLVRDAWGPRVPVSEVARALVGLSPWLNGLITTSLDRQLEWAFGGSWSAIDRAVPDLAKETRVIFKVRGTIEDPARWMLTACKQENSSFFGAMHRRELEALLRSHVLLFVGFPPDDEEFRRLLEVRGHLVDDKQRSSTETLHPDVALVPEALWTEHARDQLDQRGIELVPLEGDYDIQAARYLGALAEELGRRTQRRVPMSGAEVEPAEPSADNPYPGLEPFTAKNERYFFGREDDLSRVLSRLGGAGTPLRQWLFVDGPSGVGKSSFLQAGLLAALRDGGAQFPGSEIAWRIVAMRPGLAPVFELAEQVHRVLVGDAPCELSASGLGARLQHATAALGEFLAAHLAEDEGLVLLVDQLEEALRVQATEARVSFAAALADLLVRSPRPVLLITSLRSDFSGDLPRLPALYERLRGASPPTRYPLAALTTAQLASAIERPAREARVELQKGLTERMIADAGHIERGEGQRGEVNPETALPLVAAVVASLYEKRDGRWLTHDAYDALKGVAGALTRRADEALQPLLKDFTDEQLWGLFRKLVYPAPQGRTTRRALSRSDALAAVGGGPKAETLLARLTGSEKAMRLVVIHGDDAAPQIDLVHDALLRGWKWLREHIDRDRVEMLRESELADAAARWHRLGCPARGLPSGAEAEYFLRVSTADNTLGRDYQSALRRHLWRRRWIVRAVIAVLVSGVLLLWRKDAMLLHTQGVVAENLKRETIQRDVTHLAEYARAFIESDYDLGATLGVEAYQRCVAAKLDHCSDAKEILLQAASLATPHQILAVPDLPVTAVALAENGMRVATGHGDGSIFVWDVDEALLPAELPHTHTAAIVALAFDRHGERLISASRDGTARLCTVANWQCSQDPIFVGQQFQEVGFAWPEDALFSVNRSRDTSSDYFQIHRLAPNDTKIMIPHEGSYTVSPDRSLIAFPWKGHTSVIRTSDGGLVAEAPFAANVIRFSSLPSQMLFSDGQTLRLEDSAGQAESITVAHSSADLLAETGAVVFVSEDAPNIWRPSLMKDRITIVDLSPISVKNVNVLGDSIVGSNGGTTVVSVQQRGLKSGTTKAFSFIDLKYQNKFDVHGDFLLARDPDGGLLRLHPMSGFTQLLSPGNVGSMLASRCAAQASDCLSVLLGLNMATGVVRVWKGGGPHPTPKADSTVDPVVRLSPDGNHLTMNAGGYSSLWNIDEDLNISIEVRDPFPFLQPYPSDPWSPSGRFVKMHDKILAHRRTSDRFDSIGSVGKRGAHSFAASDDRVFASFKDGLIVVSALRRGRLVGIGDAQVDVPIAMAVTPRKRSTRRVLALRADHTIQQWRVDKDKLSAIDSLSIVTEGAMPIVDGRWDSDAGRLWTLDRAGTLNVYQFDVERGESDVVKLGTVPEVAYAHMSTLGSALAGAYLDGKIFHLKLPGGTGGMENPVTLSAGTGIPEHLNADGDVSVYIDRERRLILHDNRDRTTGTLHLPSPMPVGSASLSHSGDTLVIAASSRILVLPTGGARLIDRVCQQVARSLSREEIERYGGGRIDACMTMTTIEDEKVSGPTVQRIPELREADLARLGAHGRTIGINRNPSRDIAASLDDQGRWQTISARPPAKEVGILRDGTLFSMGALYMHEERQWAQTELPEIEADQPERRELFAVSPDRRLLLFCRSNYFEICASERCFRILSNPSVDYLWYGRCAAEITDNGDVATDCGEYTQIYLGGEESIAGTDRFKFSPKGDVLVLASNDGTVQVQRLGVPGIPRILPRRGLHDKAIERLAVSADGNLIAGTSGSEVFVWTLSNRGLPWAVETKADHIFDVAFSADGGSLIAATKGGEILTWTAPFIRR